MKFSPGLTQSPAMSRMLRERHPARQLDELEGIQRRGVVPALLSRLEQICNHPSQWLGDE